MVWEILGILFAWTWPIWAFVFVFCLAAAISRAVQEAGDGKSRGSGWYAFGAARARAGLLGGLGSLIVMAVGRSSTNDRGEMR